MVHEELTELLKGKTFLGLSATNRTVCISVDDPSIYSSTAGITLHPPQCAVVSVNDYVSDTDDHKIHFVSYYGASYGFDIRICNQSFRPLGRISFRIDGFDIHIPLTVHK